MLNLGHSLMSIALILGGILVTGPVSGRLARAVWPSRNPRAALVLWQALCLGAGLSLIGGPLVIAISPLDGNLPVAFRYFLGNLAEGIPFAGLRWPNIVAGTIAIGIGLLLCGALVLTLIRTLRRRRDHRESVDILAMASKSPAGTEDHIRVVDHPVAMAYSLPGRQPRMVLSVGLLDLLDPVELSAVTAHERAHLSLRDDLVQLPFQTWALVFSWVPGVLSARAAVAELAEMLADDVALRNCEARTLATALAKVALAGGKSSPGSDAWAPTGDHGVEGAVAGVNRRVSRLLDPRPIGRGSQAGLYLLAAALIILPSALLLNSW